MRLEFKNKDYINISEYNITLKYDSIAHIFDFRTQLDILDYILEYPECKFYDNDLLLTGTILSPNKKVSNKPEFLRYTGYGIAGVLQDCPIPISLYPLQFDNLSLLDITKILLEPFGLNYIFTSNILDDLNKKYKKVDISPEMKIKQILNNLASQRNIILTSNNFGEIVYTRYDKTKFRPVAYFEEGKEGLSNLSLSMNAQALHSEITVIKEASKDNPDAGQFTITNPYVDVFRPTVKILNSGDIFDVEKAARNELSKELSNIKITFRSTVFVNAGNTISLLSPKIGINKPTELFVQQTVIKKEVKEQDSYILTCLLPDIFSDNEVINILK